MTPEDQQRMNELCTRIQQEPDAVKLTALVDELNDLLGKKDGARKIPETQKTA